MYYSLVPKPPPQLLSLAVRKAAEWSLETRLVVCILGYCVYSSVIMLILSCIVSHFNFFLIKVVVLFCIVKSVLQF